LELPAMTDTLNRRTFLECSAAATAAGLLTAALPHSARGEDAVPEMPIVDTHQHLWDLDKFRLPWIEKGTVLARSYLPKDYAEATSGLNVVKSVYMEVDVDPKQQDAEAEYVIGLCEQGDVMKAAVISGRPASEGFRDYIMKYKDSPYIKGVRQVLHGDSTPKGYCLDKQFVRSVRLLGEMGMSFDLCMRPAELPDAAKLIDECPDTRFILDHCGNAEVPQKDRTDWKRDMADVARRKNVVCKVSGIIASAKPGEWTADDLAPIVNHTLEVFGPDRVMFGGDWPVCTLAASYRQWVEALKSIVAERSMAEQRKLFHDNAVRFYGLS
jgi:L-fuconolactonase